MRLGHFLNRKLSTAKSSNTSVSKPSTSPKPPMANTAETVKAEYRQLGKAGIRVSAPILGGMSIGNPAWNPFSLPEEKAFPLLQAAWDSGVTTWDLANMYSNGESEVIVGKFLKQKNIPRNQVVLIDKIRFLVDHEQPSTVTSFFRPELKDTREYVNHGGLSRIAVFNQVEDCLKRLQTDYIDILLIHAPDADTPFEETMCALNDLIRSGKVHYIGASNVKVWQFVEMNNIAASRGWATFSCVQMEHSLIYRTEERDLFAYCEYKGIGIMAYSPLMEGHLARQPGTVTERSKAAERKVIKKKIRDCDLEIIKRVSELAGKHSWAMSQVALAWSLTRVSSPVVGANSPERLREAIVKGKRLTAEEVKYLESPYLAQPPRF